MAEASIQDSTAQQDVDKQRYGVLASAHTWGLIHLQLVAETASGQLAWCERAIGRMLTAPVQGGDLVRCASVRCWPTRHDRGWQ